MVADNNTDKPGECREEERGRFFRAADLTLREGGFVHSNLVLERSGVSCTEQQMIDVMRAWCESRDYPLSRIHMGRMGSILMGLLGCGALILGLVASIEGNRSGRTVGNIILALSIPLIIGAVVLWRSTSRIRNEHIRNANTICPECRERLIAAAGCGCGYLTSTDVVDGNNSRAREERGTLAADDTPPHTLPEEADKSVWQIRTATSIKSFSSFAELREDILEGDVASSSEFRIVNSSTDTDDVQWAPINELSESMYEFGMLYNPVRAHMARGGIFGAVVGIGWWLLNLLATAFGDMNNPVIGGIGVLAIWAVVNSRLSGQALFFSSRILWGATVLGAMFAFQNYAWNSIVSSVATGLGMIAGAIVSGAVVGWLLGAAVGTLAGLIRRDSLCVAPDAKREDTKTRILYGVVAPLVTLAVLVFAYIYLAIPLLKKMVGE